MSLSSEIVAIWIKRARRGPMDPVDEAELLAGRGIAGNAEQGGWRQVTIIDEAAWEAATRDLGAGVDPSLRRANIMIRGVDLENSRGKHLHLGECVINVRGENPPCRLMQEMQEPLRPHWRAGVFGDIAQGGTIHVGDAVTMR